MYKIMLADDEGIVIDSLKFIIDKNFAGKCEIESAKTGRKVIELAENFRPDIAFMDIQMPGINGIEAMKEIRKANSKVIFIVMTAYDKFDYAKEAINLGVMDYLNKPVNQETIVEVLKKAMARVDSEKERRSQDLLIKEKLETVTPILESGLIYNMLFHEHFTEDIENYKSILDIQQDTAYMMGVVCGDAQEGNHMTNAVGSSVRIQEYYQSIRSHLKEYFEGCIVGTVMANKIAVLVPCSTSTLDYNTRIDLIEKSRELVRALRKKTDISFRIGIGKVKKLEKMSESYTEALNSLVYTTGSVAHADDLPIGCDYESDYPIDLENKLFECVEKGDVEVGVATAGEYFDWMLGNGNDAVMSTRLKTLEFALWAEHLVYLNGGMTYRFTDREEYLPICFNTEDMGALKNWFVDRIGQACQNMMNKRNERSDSQIHTAIDYINNNYTSNISLDDVSRVINISPYYFSKLFKEETGEGFVEYLTKLRIEKAKDLLLNTDMPMKEICLEVGYPDPNYFSRTFKKNYGVTPTEYKEGLRNDN